MGVLHPHPKFFKEAEKKKKYRCRVRNGRWAEVVWIQPQVEEQYQRCQENKTKQSKKFFVNMEENLPFQKTNTKQ